MSTVALLSADWMLRGITIGLLLLIAAVLLRDHRKSVAAQLAVAVGIGTTAYVICSGPGAISVSCPAVARQSLSTTARRSLAGARPSSRAAVRSASPRSVRPRPPLSTESSRSANTSRSFPITPV